MYVTCDRVWPRGDVDPTWSLQCDIPLSALGKCTLHLILRLGTYTVEFKYLDKFQILIMRLKTFPTNGAYR